jgi:hypothetical protein
MGTSLTGLTPATTYDALIKVGDNGALSATAKVLSDGLGNDSPLAMSTTLVGISTNAPSYPLGIVGDTGLEGNENYLYFHSSANVGSNARARIRAVGAGGGSGFGGDLRIDTRAQNNVWNTNVLTVANDGNVGIGTTTPISKLEVSAGTTIYPINITSSSGAATTTGISMGSFTGLGGGANGSVYIASAHNHAATAQSDMVFYTHTGSALTEKGRFLASGGLTFNGDTSASNALDDYEEGTWTMGVAFGGGTTGITYSTNTGTYTKIGRQVTVNGYLELTSKGSSGGAATITGLPFTIPNLNQNYSAVSLWFNAITFANQFIANGTINTTTISLQESTILGVNSTITDADFANNSGIIVNFTYFV